MSKKAFYEIDSVLPKAFGDNIELLPNVDELFELEMAFLEFNCLSKEELIKRSAFIKSVENTLTHHFLLYSNYDETVNENRTNKTQTYFKEGQYSTGYSTHGLFPYRGKFHPQLIKGLLNILEIKEGDTILDPMAGSGTANIEAAHLGINSYASDISPFCQFMTKVKFESLTINPEIFTNINLESDKLFEFFKKGKVIERIEKIEEKEKQKLYNLSFLAWLDALGYSKRVVRSTHKQLFDKVLSRYIDSVKSIINNPYFTKVSLGKVNILKDSNALNIKLPDNSVDCVITSPPYSFAIDYVQNDKDQLEFLGYDTKELKQNMVGLRGKNKTERLENYFLDMDKMCHETSRVLKSNKYFVMIIGSNTNQTGGIRLEQSIIDSSLKYNMHLVKSILKPIKGMRNTMKDEYILIFKKK